MKPIALILAALLLSGCQTGKPIDDPVVEIEQEPLKVETAWDTCSEFHPVNQDLPPKVCTVRDAPFFVCADRDTANSLFSLFIDVGGQEFMKAYDFAQRIKICKLAVPTIISEAAEKPWRDGEVGGQRVEIYAIEVQDSNGETWSSNYMAAQDEAI